MEQQYIQERETLPFKYTPSSVETQRQVYARNNSPFRLLELPERLQRKYNSPICDETKFGNCVPWAKKGARLGFQYTWDAERMNNCNNECNKDNQVTQTCCQNRGQYTGYRGRCTGYDEYFQDYHPVYGI